MKRVTFHRRKQLFPFLLFRVLSPKPDFDTGLARVAGRAKRLQVRWIEGEFRRIAHGLDVIDLEASPRAALDAAELIAAQDFEA